MTNSNHITAANWSRRLGQMLSCRSRDLSYEIAAYNAIYKVIPCGVDVELDVADDGSLVYTTDGSHYYKAENGEPCARPSVSTWD